MKTDDHLLLTLLSRAISKTTASATPQLRLSPALWVQTIELADRQEVLGLAFGAIEQFSKELLPTKEVLLACAAQVCATERDYTLYRQRCIEGLQALQAARIPFVLMKGLLIANLYPQPERRTIGDVDLLFGRNDFSQAIRFFQAQQSAVDLQPDSKHATATHLGLNWELHFKSIYFFNWLTEKRYHQLEMAETASERLCLESIGGGVFIPSLPPVFRIIYLTAHIQHHLILEEIKMRHVVDWALVLRHNRTALAIGEASLTSHLKSLGLWKLYRSLGHIATHHLGLESDSYAGCAHLSGKEARNGEFLLNTILDGHLPGCKSYQPHVANETYTTKARLWGELLKRCIKLLCLVPREAAATPIGILLKGLRRRFYFSTKRTTFSTC